MKKTIGIAICCCISMLSFAQVTGVQTIPGSFASVQAAVLALNTFGVGPGGATINIAPGYTETSTGPLVLTIAVNGPTATNPLVFQKSGPGTNPLITAHTGTSTTLDGMFILNGVDYVTIDGIDLQENAANTNTTMQMEWGYAILKTGATNGAQYNTIKNCVVTLNKTNTASVGIYVANHTTASTAAITVASLNGANSYNKIYNNTVQNVYTGMSIVGYAAAAPYEYYDQGNEIGRDGVSMNRSQVLNFGGAAANVNGIVANNQNRLKVFGTNINGGTGSTGAINGISLVAGTNSNVDVYNDTISVTTASTTGALNGITNGMGGTGAGSVVNIYGCVVTNCSMTAALPSGEFRGIASTATASYTNIYNNTVSNNTQSGSGNFSAIFYSGSSVTLCLAVNIHDNTISGNTKSGVSGQFNGINFDVPTFVSNIYNNQIFNNTATATSGGVYGYYNFNGVGATDNIYNNTVFNLMGGAGATSGLFASSGNGATYKNVYGNTVYGISGNSSGASVSGIFVGWGTVENVYGNNIYNITNNTTTGVTGAACGIVVDGNQHITTTLSNNFISEISAPSSNNPNAVIGIYTQGSANSALNIVNNTVYLNGTSAGTNFGSTAFYATATPLRMELRNNILVNLCTPTGTGTARAITRTTTTFTNYVTTSGNNCVYAGAPSATHVIYYDGTTNYQTLQAFKNQVGAREQASFTENPSFVNTATSPYDLHLQAAMASQCESGGWPYAGITTDYDGTVRNSTFPDVGADEYTGVMMDIASPNIQYTALTNISVATTRSCPNFATITDPSGINTTPGTRPRLYYKKSTNANTYNTNTNATDGWKYVEATNTSSPFSFTIDYTLVFGGSVVAGDIIQYFVVAQDLAGTPVFGINSGGLTVQPTSVNLSAANFPLTGTINQYTIVAVPLSGTINVGPTELITSLTNAGGMFDIINQSVLSGNLTINITGDLTAETGTIALNQWAEEGTGGYSVSIVPSAATTRNIYGSSAGAALIRFNGADRVNIDGRFASAGTFLMFRNTSNTAPTIGFLNDAQNNTVQYSVIESGNTSTTAALGGAVWIGTTTGPNGNDNITISNCEIRDRSDVAGTPAFGINCTGSANPAQYNNNCTISNNNIHDWYLLNSTTQYGLFVQPGNSGFTISGNSFYQTAARTNTVSTITVFAATRAIIIATTSATTLNGGFTITGNFIGGTAPGATGGDMVYNVTGTAYHTFGAISVGTGMIPNTIQNNVIRKIDYSTTSPTVAGGATMWFGINLGQGIHTCDGNTIGDPATTGNIKISVNTGGTTNAFLAGILSATSNGTTTVTNNNVGSIVMSGTTTTAVIGQWIQIQGTPNGVSTVTGNTVGSTTVANSISCNITTGAYVGFGLRCLTSSGYGHNVSGNTIQGLTNSSAIAGTVDYGALMISTVGSAGTINFTGNTIRDINAGSGAASPALMLMGLSIQGFNGTSHNIAGNLVAGIALTNTGVFQGYAVGIQMQGASSGGTVTQNRIFDIRNTNTGASPGVMGIYQNAGMNWTFSNNMISITNGTNTNFVDMGGIISFMAPGTTFNAYYNSIFLGGSVASGSGTSICLGTGNNANITMKNNLLYNKRTGGTGSHVAIGNIAATGTGWNTGSSNYNAFVVADTTKIGIWGVTPMNMSSWRATSNGDAMSIWQTSGTVTSPALYSNTNAGNLHINTSTFPEALGTPIAGITVDYDGNPRSATTPTIGADELACSNIVFTTTAQTNVTCNGGNNGSATVGGTGGNGITYVWSPAVSTTATATGLSAGTYTVTISNICGNTGTVTVTITEPAAVSATMASTPVSCNGGTNGSATATGTGGSGTYTYSWSSGGTAATETNLAMGTYTCTITDVNGCTGTQTVAVTEPTVLTATTMQTNPTCNGGTNGDAMVMPSGGTSPYTYAWSSGGTGSMEMNLGAGSYTCIITDAGGCTNTQTVTLTSPSAITSTSSQTDPTCNGGTNGSAAVSVSGGTPGYTYMWSPSGGTGATETGIGAGSYTCTTTDAAGCTHTDTFTLTAPTALSAAGAVTNVSCFGGNNGDAMVSVSGGTPGYTYLWSPSGGTGATETGLIAGTYTVVTTDAAGCTRSDFFLITEPPAMASAISGTNPTTCGGTDGAVDLTPSGGVGPYIFLWSNSAITEDISGVAAGAYSVTITDNNGCTATNSATLNDPNAPTVTLSLPIDTVCQTTTSPFALTGETPSGGTFAGPGVTAGTFDPMMASIGMVTITYTYTDVNGCTGSTSDSLYNDICLDVPTAEAASFNLYPNPNDGVFNIELNTTEAAQVIVYDAIGQIVLTQQVQPGVQEKLFLESSGAYMVTVITSDGTRTSQRVIVTR